jgi:hypothetical protein
MASWNGITISELDDSMEYCGSDGVCGNRID